MSSIILIASPNEDRNGSSASWITYSSTSLSALITNLLNSNNGKNVGSGWKGQIGNYVKSINNNEDCIARLNYGTNSDLYSTLRFQFTSQADRDYYESDLAGKLLEIIGIEGIPWNGSYTNIPVYWFKMVLPHLTSQDSIISLISPTCLWDKYQDLALGDLDFSNNAMSSTFMMAGENYTPPEGQTKFGLFSISENIVPPDPECEDLRTSVPPHTLRFTITNGELSVTKDLDCYCTASDNVFPFDSSVFTNQEVKDIFTMFMQYGAKRVRCAARFISGNVRSNCSVKLNVSVTGFRCYCDIIGPYFGIGSEELTPTIKQCFDASFVECFDKPISYTENLSTYCEGLVNTGDGWCIFLDPQNITVSNLECETDVCCDDVSENEIDEIVTPQVETLGGFVSGGGGSDVDITCICDGLTSLNQMLASKLDNLVDGQAVIADAISEMQVEVDNTCVCDNLESINDNLEAIKDSIDDKNLSVVNNNTVQPPVNNISVQPPVNNISLPTTQLENIATNTRALNCVCASLQNLEVIEQGTKESIDGVKSNLECGNDGLACILQGKDISVDVDLNTTDLTNGLEAITEKLDDIDNSVHDGLINSDDESNLEIISQSLNTSDDEPISLADVIKNKDMGTNIDVEVSPADDVNINRVYYTNQRNGEANI